MKFRKKPVVIEAIQWTGENFVEIATWAHKGCPPEMNSIITRPLGAFDGMAIRTLESGLGNLFIATEMDWIIKGVKGEFYACKPDIFEATYEKVEP